MNLLQITWTRPRITLEDAAPEKELIEDEGDGRFIQVMFLTNSSNSEQILRLIFIIVKCKFNFFLLV